MSPSPTLARFQELQRYVGWTDDDRERVRQAAWAIAPQVPSIVDDFYDEIRRHPQIFRLVTGGTEQLDRLKASLKLWVEDLFAGHYDEAYIARRTKVGRKHVDLKLPQVYVNAAFGRLRTRFLAALSAHFEQRGAECQQLVLAVNRLLDLDLILINDAYEAEFTTRQQAAERERMAGVLHQEREFSDGVLAHAHAAVVVVDPQGKLLRGNAFFWQLVQRQEADCLGQDWFATFLSGDDAARIRASWLTSPSAELPEWAARLSPAGSSPRDLRWSATPLRDAQGAFFALLILGHDVTELHQAQERTLQVERLAAIGQMATGLAHESRNALQRIQACAEMLEIDLDGNSGALDLLGRIKNAQSQVGRLLEEVRQYAAPVRLEVYPAKLCDIWREAWDTLSPQRAQRTAHLTEEVGEIDLRARVDRFRIGQVFRNLLENSLAAAADPVEIKIYAQNCRIHGQEALLITFLDNGPGLNDEQKKHIFDPFYTTKAKGTGLGMAIAQRLVEAHGGTIRVGSNSSPGARIEVTLPRGVI